jgi:hypothetical protein
MRGLARVSGRVVWPGECPGGAGQLPPARGQHDCPWAVPAVEQAPRGGRREFGGRGPSVSTAAASARCSLGERLGGVAVGVQVTVTDSHHPALQIAPGCSSRRQCPRATCTRSSQRPWPARCAGMLTIVAPLTSLGIIVAAAPSDTLIGRELSCLRVLGGVGFPSADAGAGVVAK